MLFIEVSVEFFQQLISVGLDDKDIINISAPHLWFPGGGLQSPCLKVFHKDIGYDWREGGTHCCFFYLLVEGLAELEIGGLQA